MIEQDPLQIINELELEVKYDEKIERTVVDRWNQNEKEKIRESMKKLGISKIIGFETLPEPTGRKKIVGTVEIMRKPRMKRENSKATGAERVRKYRKTMTEDAKNLVRIRDNNRKRKYKQNLTEDAKNLARERDRKRKAERRAQMSDDEKKNLR